MFEQLKDVFDRCFKIGQSQCALLLGNRSNVVPKMIGKVAEGYSPLVVTISGLLCQDDLQALQCISMQLANYLEIPYTESNFQSSLAFLRQNLNENVQIVICIYDIQEFAHKNLKQLLLYTIFELVHEEICKMCVIGITNRLDFIELLEKRIKSRFSYQNIIMMDPQTLENLVEGLEIEDFNAKAIQELNSLHMIILISYIRIAMKNLEISMIRAFKEFENFKAKSPMIIYEIDKFTFNIVTNYFVKVNLLKIVKKHTIQRFSLYKLNFDPTSICYSIKRGTLKVPTAAEEWINSL